MKVLTKRSVYEAAKERIRFVFEEFENVYVNVSGGKDSTVVLNVALEVAEEMGRLPVKVSFIDQEAEWQAVIDYMREIMADPRVEPYWYQMPIKISNSSSFTDEWLYCWKEGDHWLREKEPYAITENVFGDDRFKSLFYSILETYHHNEKACYLAGVRCEESPNRATALTTREKYKGVTWAKQPEKAREHYTFYPLYDWSYTDVWKYIHDAGVSYCKVYDYFYQKGVPIQKMRVSNLHHETSVASLYLIEEFEKDTWNNLVERLGGVHVTRSLEYSDMFQAPKRLPWMFRTWTEYRDHLTDKLIDPHLQAQFRAKFAEYDKRYAGMTSDGDLRLKKSQISAILANDFHFTKLENFDGLAPAQGYRKWKNQGRIGFGLYLKWIPPEKLEASRLAKIEADAAKENEV